MHAFVVSGLVFSIPSQEVDLGKRLRNDLFCVEWGVKPQLSQSSMHVAEFLLKLSFARYRMRRSVTSDMRRHRKTLRLGLLTYLPLQGQ